MTWTVLLDSQAFDRQIRGGVSRYFAELYRHKHLLAPAIELAFGRSWTINEHLAAADPEIYRVGEFSFSRIEVTRALARLLAHRAPRDWRDAAVLHHTFYSAEVIRATPGKPRISTLFDMIPERFPDMVKSRSHGDKLECLQRSDVICAISRTARDELLSVWPQFESKPIVVTPLGVDARFRPSGPVLRRPFPYVLWVGDRRGYKNFATLARALDLLAGSRPRVDLVVVGGTPISKSERSLLGDFLSKAEIIQLFPSDTELPAVYRGALLHVTASLSEGFGLSPLEALASGTQSLASDIPAHREVLGDAASLFRATDEVELATRIESHIHAGDVNRDVRVRRGLHQASKFTWIETALGTGIAYRRALGMA